MIKCIGRQVEVGATSMLNNLEISNICRNLVIWIL